MSVTACRRQILHDAFELFVELWRGAWLSTDCCDEEAIFIGRLPSARCQDEHAPLHALGQRTTQPPQVRLFQLELQNRSSLRLSFECRTPGGILMPQPGLARPSQTYPYERVASLVCVHMIMPVICIDDQILSNRVSMLQQRCQP